MLDVRNGKKKKKKDDKLVIQFGEKRGKRAFRSRSERFNKKTFN